MIPGGALLGILAVGCFLRAKREGWAFLMTSLTIPLAMATIFLALDPRVMVSSLTIYNASSSDYTLGVISIIALTFMPVVGGYET